MCAASFSSFHYDDTGLHQALPVYQLYDLRRISFYFLNDSPFIYKIWIKLITLLPH